MSFEIVDPEIVIEARGLSKTYAIFQRPADRLKQMLSLGRRRYYAEYQALRDVDLQVRRGETFGIVGRNGSGKSTLLQLVCGTLQPSAGDLAVRGRIAALLELGAGFNPEFTGRENVFLNASLLGQSEARTRERFDDIAAFADIGPYIDQPVKTYSSGMFARLAFAVAVHVDPDILVVDEALSVGDEMFQRKCFNRIQDLKTSGVTILVVSHSAATVTELCDRAMVLDAGERILVGPSKLAMVSYHKLIHAKAERAADLRAELKALDAQLRQGAPGAAESVAEHDADDYAPPAGPAVDRSGLTADYDPGLVPESLTTYLPNGAEILDAEIRDVTGRRVNLLVLGEEYEYTYRVAFLEDAFKVRFGCLVKTLVGVELMGVNSHAADEGIPVVRAGEDVRVAFRFRNLFLPNVYFLNAGVVGVVNGEEAYLHRIVDAAMFRTLPGRRSVVSGYVQATAEPHCTVVRMAAAEEPDRRAVPAG